MATGDPSQARSLFAQFHEALEAGESVDFEAFCAEHPDCADDLKRFQATWEQVKRALKHTAGGAGPDSTPEILGRLAHHGSAASRYQVVDEVGQGGMGVVLRVWDKELHRHLAMKVLKGKAAPKSSGDPAPVDPQRLVRFLEEAKVTSQLDHPGIVPIHELGLDDSGSVYFTMKLVNGESLASVFGKVREDLDGWNRTRALGVLLKVCEAMSYAHSKGVLHRDLKPPNVMVGHFGEVYVMDWGLARVIGQEDAKEMRIRPHVTPDDERTEDTEAAAVTPDSPLLTMDGDVIGTPAYMSPEQALGQVDKIGRHSDVYSAGAMLYELLAGHKPYVKPGMRVSSQTIRYRVQGGPPEPLHERARDLPADLEAICERAMARAPDARYASIESLEDDLRAFLEGRVVGTYETGAWAETKKWVQRNKPLALSLASAVVLLVAGLVTALALRQQAVGNAELARKRAEDVLSLSAFQKLVDLEKSADELWPPHPEHIEAYDTWLIAATELAAGLDPAATSDDIGHRARLEALRAGALPWTEEGTRREWHFADENDRWWHNQLTLLVDELEAFADPVTGLVEGTSLEHGRGVRWRREWAEGIGRLTLQCEEAALEWTQAIERIRANPTYEGLELRPQLGLLPLGAHPTSGLEEFGHPLSGIPPGRGKGGELQLAEDSGLVLVLLPGGRYLAGAQKDPSKPNHDPDAKYDEAPVHEVAVGAFFCSKYEMTQGQWRQMTSENPSQYAAGGQFGGLRATLAHPVESVSASDCERVLGWMGLSLPSEAQWEYAARGGALRFWAELDGDGFRQHANLADQAHFIGGSTTDVFEAWNDGHAAHAPVGTFLPNGFGLHDVIGNLAEWCGEHDPVYSGAGTMKPSLRIYRGGSHENTRRGARVTNRPVTGNETRESRIGVRPVRSVADP